MKLALLGAGVRTPLLIHGLIRRQETLELREVALYDADPGRLATMAAFTAHVAATHGAKFRITTAADFRVAATGAAFVFSSLRVGQERHRILDERIPLKYGVLGQETTGAGGFAMALRTIPVLLDYAEQLAEVAPDAWFVNFTNPSGLITQALTSHSRLRRVVGICDAPTAMLTGLASFLGRAEDDLFVDYFGLNHLGWVRRVLVDGRDLLPELLDRYEALSATGGEWGLFDADLVRALGLIPNEYLYYFYYRERAVENILASAETRGEQIQTINEPLWRELRDHLAAGRPEEAVRAYEARMGTRSATYMARESGSGQKTPRASESIFAGEGYAGLAMAAMEAVLRRRRRTLILNVPNRGALRELADDDVVEVASLIDQHGIAPLSQAPMPAVTAPLVRAVKQYERLTVEAAITGSYDTALLALAGHPLVMSFSLAGRILDDYLEAHREFLPRFATTAATTR
jgi:6-phospho-beta-glucosidase